MNTILILSVLTFGAIGILIKNYWEAQLAKIVQKQVGIKASSNAVDVLNGMFGNSVKINRIEATKGIGADYYSPLSDEFFLTEDTEKYNSASVTIAYFLGLLKIVSKKSSSASAFSNILILSSLLNPALIVFIIITIFSTNTIYFNVVICIYVTLVLIEIISNKIHFQLTKSFITKSFQKNNISISKVDLISLKEYSSLRWLQLVTMLLFHPLLVSYYYVSYFIKK